MVGCFLRVSSSRGANFVFWGLFLYLGVVVAISGYKLPFLIFGLHVFFGLVQKTRLTSRLHFFQLIFVVSYFVGGLCRHSKFCFE